MYLWTWGRGRKAVRQPLVRSFSLQSSRFLEDGSDPTRHERCWVRMYSLCSAQVCRLDRSFEPLPRNTGRTHCGKSFMQMPSIDEEKESPSYLPLLPPYKCPYKCLPWLLALSWEAQTPCLWGSVGWRLALGKSKEPNHLCEQDKDIWITPACPAVYPGAQERVLLERSKRWSSDEQNQMSNIFSTYPSCPLL